MLIKRRKGRTRKLAERFLVSLSFVQRLIRRQKNTGQVSVKAHGGGTKALITQEGKTLVQQLVEAQPDALLSELCERMDADSGIVVSVTTCTVQFND